MKPRQRVEREEVLPPQFDKPFDEFWAAYPSRGPFGNPRRDAKASYIRAIIRDHADPETLTKQAQAYKVWCEIMGWSKTSFVCMAQTWLNQARWEADYEVGYHMVTHMPVGVERELVVERITEYLGRQDGSA